MKTVVLLGQYSHFYKANLHAHSVFSDGRLTPEQLKKAFMERGYAIIAFSDHNRLTPHNELRDADFLPLNAIEIDVNDDKGHTYHLNFFSSDPEKTAFPPIDRVYGVDGINRIIATGNEAGFLCQYNHPRWSFQDAHDFVGLRGLWGFEVFNTGCEKEMLNGWGDYEYETLLREGNEFPCAVATDDNHNAHPLDSPHCDSFSGWVCIDADCLTYEVIFDAMREKRLYASTGPAIHRLEVDPATGMVTVNTSPACAIALRCETRYTPIVRSLQDDLTTATLQLPADYRYFRLEIADSHGNKAMTRAYTPKDLL